MTRCARRFLLVAALLAAPGARAESVPAAATSLPGTAATLRDFMIQDVCLDARGQVVVGRAPLPGDPACAARRDLAAGERLPYHKHDHTDVAESVRRLHPAGHQRRDGFPVETARFGTVVVHGADFGPHGGRFGMFDRPVGDGGDIVILTDRMAAVGATEDGGAGFQLFVNAGCAGALTEAHLRDSWILATVGPTLDGEAVARLKDLKPGAQDACPTRINAAFTRWATGRVTFRAGERQGAPVTLVTLVSDHYGAADPARADHAERFYFTRELGPTRWERWQDPHRTRGETPEGIARRATAFAAAGRCSPAEAPARNPALVMVDCREWSAIQPPDAADGDPPDFFAKWLAASPAAARWFAAPVP